MSRARRIRQQEKQRVQEVQAVSAAQPPVAHALMLLAAAFLLPNLGALICGFVLDDLPLIVENEKLHSLRHLGQIWTSGYWPDRTGLTAYRPVSQTVWAALWTIGRGHPAAFHAIGLALGLAVVLLIYRFLLAVKTPPRTAFIAALLFALFPIHTEATTSVVGSAELLAAAFGVGSLILYYRGRRIPALLLFALAVFSKESAAAFAALPLVFPGRDGHSCPSGRARMAVPTLAAALAALAIIGGALLAHRAVSRASFIPPIDNPMGLLDDAPRILSALWVQFLYLFKAIVPIALSADYSYKQIPLVMGLDDIRAWVGLALLGSALFLVVRRRELRPAVLAYAALFSSTANVLFPIGTMMGERLAYVPSLGLALLLAIPLARSRHWKTVLLVVALAYGGRTFARNLDWRNADTFYTSLMRTSPNSAKSFYFYGILRSSHGDDLGAIDAYDRAIAIFPAYSEAYHNRGNALARLGRRAEAMESYRACLRFDPGHAGAASNLMQLQAGLPLAPPRKHL